MNNLLSSIQLQVILILEAMVKTKLVVVEPCRKSQLLSSNLLTDGKKDLVTNGMSQGGAVGGASLTGPIDEDLFDDEDLDELEEDLENLEV